MVGGTGHLDINLAGRVLAGVASIVVRGCLPDGGTCPVATFTTLTAFLHSVARVRAAKLQSTPEPSDAQTGANHLVLAFGTVTLLIAFAV